MYRTAAVALAGLCLCVGLVGQVPPTPIEIEAIDGAGGTGQATFRVSPGSPCQLTWTGQDTPATCTVALAPDVAEITLTGAFARQGQPRRSGTMRWRVVDIASIVAVMRDRSRPFGERILASIEQGRRFEARLGKTHGLGLVEFEPAQPATARDVLDAEQRLGHALPPEHHSLLTRAGALTVGDSSFVAASAIKKTLDAMIADWESEAARLDRILQPAVKTLYSTSALLFTSAGDGYGGLVYRPAGEAACGGPAFYWVQQDAINRPRLLTSRTGRCKDYAAAILWVVIQESLSQLEDSEPDVVVVDLSSPAPFRLSLTYDSAPFVFRLRPRWAEAD